MQFREYFLPFVPDFIFPFTIENRPNNYQNIHTNNFVGCFIRVWNSVSHIKEEHRLKAFNYIVFRKAFRTKMKEVPKGWRKLHNEELHHLKPSPDIICVIEWRKWDGGTYPTGGTGRIDVYRAFVWKHNGKRRLRRPRRELYDNIKRDLKSIG